MDSNIVVQTFWTLGVEPPRFCTKLVKVDADGNQQGNIQCQQSPMIDWYLMGFLRFDW